MNFSFFSLSWLFQLTSFIINVFSSSFMILKGCSTLSNWSDENPTCQQSWYASNLLQSLLYTILLARSWLTEIGSCILYNSFSMESVSSWSSPRFNPVFNAILLRKALCDFCFSLITWIGLGNAATLTDAVDVSLYETCPWWQSMQETAMLHCFHDVCAVASSLSFISRHAANFWKAAVCQKELKQLRSWYEFFRRPVVFYNGHILCV